MSKSTSPKGPKGDDLKRRPIHKQNLYPKIERDESDGCSNDESSQETETLKHSIAKDEEQDSIQNDSKIPVSNKLLGIDFNLCKWFLLIILIYGSYCFSAKYIFSSESSPKTNIDIRQIIQEMELKFSNQPQYLFKVFKVALSKVIKKNVEPAAPAIITLMADRGAIDTALEFSKYVAQSLAPGKYVTIDKSEYGHNNPDDIKLKIENKILSKLRNDTLNVVVVDRFEKIPITAAMIFHNYCDHETARFKHAVYLLTFSLDRDVPKDISSKELDKIAMQHMKQLWRHAHSDFIDSFITRITVSVVNIKKQN